MLSMPALHAALRHLSRMAQCISEDGKPLCLCHHVVSFELATNDLIVPPYLKSAHAIAVTLTDGGKTESICPLPARPVKQKLFSM